MRTQWTVAAKGSKLGDNGATTQHDGLIIYRQAIICQRKKNRSRTEDMHLAAREYCANFPFQTVILKRIVALYSSLTCFDSGFCSVFMTILHPHTFFNMPTGGMLKACIL